MKRFFEKHGKFDEDDAIRYIKRHLDGYSQGGGSGGSGGGSGGGQSNQGGGGSSYHSSGGPEIILRELASLIEMVEDFFAEKGLDARTYMESHRRGR